MTISHISIVYKKQHLWYNTYIGGDIIAGEKNFENRIKRWLVDHGIYPPNTPKQKIRAKPIGYYEKRFGSQFSINGLPDMHICINGHSIDLELKDVRGKPSAAQVKILENINNWGCEGYLVYPKDWPTIENRLLEVINEAENS